jgi:hypothetical protein
MATNHPHGLGLRARRVASRPLTMPADWQGRPCVPNAWLPARTAQVGQKSNRKRGPCVLVSTDRNPWLRRQETQSGKWLGEVA